MRFGDNRIISASSNEMDDLFQLTVSVVTQIEPPAVNSILRVIFLLNLKIKRSRDQKVKMY